MENQHKDFIEEYNAAVQTICEKHKKELVPVFRFGEQWLPAQLVVNVQNSDKSETNGSADSGFEEAEK